ncbi:Hypothetical_protein [Hexamita inflata]|uniref:Hypothetical_protein n=1 Tax=Hexamita inflata TaxID=28002 RepID=A0AA86QLG8_9EUKA|nr:Hypothetical protein HINF_LOCUS41575 [Hexamita inflata]
MKTPQVKQAIIKPKSKIQLKTHSVNVNQIVLSHNIIQNMHSAQRQNECLRTQPLTESTQIYVKIQHCNSSPINVESTRIDSINEFKKYFDSQLPKLCQIYINQPGYYQNDFNRPVTMFEQNIIHALIVNHGHLPLKVISLFINQTKVQTDTKILLEIAEDIKSSVEKLQYIESKSVGQSQSLNMNIQQITKRKFGDIVIDSFIAQGIEFIRLHFPNLIDVETTGQEFATISDLLNWSSKYLKIALQPITIPWKDVQMIQALEIMLNQYQQYKLGTNIAHLKENRGIMLYILKTLCIVERNQEIRQTILHCSDIIKQIFV